MLNMSNNGLADIRPNAKPTTSSFHFMSDTSLLSSLAHSFTEHSTLFSSLSHSLLIEPSTTKLTTTILEHCLGINLE